VTVVTGFVNKPLMTYNPQDHFFKKAKEQKFAARSVFKLEEIDLKFKLIERNDLVLDLGASPGSWSQYASKKIGPDGKLIGIDLNPVKKEVSGPLKNAEFIVADLRDLNLTELFNEKGFRNGFDLVVSDMAPKTTGIRMTDQARSMELCQLALSAADKFLKKNGHFVCKFFHSEDFEVLRKQMKERFNKVEALKPDATRKISKEIFLIGLKKK
jgi:23S rRNA (uridine2552-2'-O)-methyltransferase